MRTTVSVIGILLVLGGLVWIAQGLNLPFAPRSFMTADRTWILIGAITAAAGMLLFGWARRQPRPAP
jgi:polyferredoxin